MPAAGGGWPQLPPTYRQLQAAPHTSPHPNSHPPRGTGTHTSEAPATTAALASCAWAGEGEGPGPHCRLTRAPQRPRPLTTGAAAQGEQHNRQEEGAPRGRRRHRDAGVPQACECEGSSAPPPTTHARDGRAEPTHTRTHMYTATRSGWVGKGQVRGGRQLPPLTPALAATEATCQLRLL